MYAQMRNKETVKAEWEEVQRELSVLERRVDALDQVGAHPTPQPLHTSTPMPMPTPTPTPTHIHNQTDTATDSVIQTTTDPDTA